MGDPQLSPFIGVYRYSRGAEIRGVMMLGVGEIYWLLSQTFAVMKGGGNVIQARPIDYGSTFLRKPSLSGSPREEGGGGGREGRELTFRQSFYSCKKHGPKENDCSILMLWHLIVT